MDLLTRSPSRIEANFTNARLRLAMTIELRGKETMARLQPEDRVERASKISDPREGRAYLATLCSDHTVDLRYDSSSLSHGRRDALGRSRPHIADGEDTGTTGLKR